MYTEHDLVCKTIRMLCKSQHECWIEVPHVGQNVDIVSVFDNQIYAIEGKLASWKRAIEQCRAHELFADFICISIGTKNVSDSFFSACQSLGYGIIHSHKSISESVWVLHPMRNKKIWNPTRLRVKEFMADYPEYKSNGHL